VGVQIKQINMVIQKHKTIADFKREKEYGDHRKNNAKLPTLVHTATLLISISASVLSRQVSA